MNSINFGSESVIPSKVVCVGRNYVEHIKELGNEMPSSMVIFNKPNSAVTDTLYYFSENVDYEFEIAFLIKENSFTGLGIGIDLTNRTLQLLLKQKGLPWERAKAFDKSCVLSEFVEFKYNGENLRLEVFKNSTLIQTATDDLMIYKPQDILNEVLTFMSFEDFDVILSGTPKGVGKYKTGDKFLAKLYINDKPVLEKEWIVK